MIAYKALNGAPVESQRQKSRDYVWGDNKKEVLEQFHESPAKVLAELHQLPKQRTEGVKLPVEEGSDLKLIMNKRMDHVKETFGVDQSLCNRWQDMDINKRTCVGTHGDVPNRNCRVCHGTRNRRA